MSGESVFHDLEPLLEQVNKPIQYVGGELNAQLKDWNCGGYGPEGEELTTRWALMYPDAYEVGLPNQGLMILYEVLNERPDALAQDPYARVFLEAAGDPRAIALADAGAIRRAAETLALLDPAKQAHAAPPPRRLPASTCSAPSA